MSYRTSQIKLNLPNKVLGVSVTEIAGLEYWPFANGDNDQWAEGSPSQRFYRWSVTFSVTEQEHGSHLSRDDFVFNGLDVRVGDWIAGSTDGKCVKIISVESKTRTEVTCTVEDWLRYNTFQNPTGNGIFNTGSAIVFSLNENGLPMLDPLPTTASATFFPIVMSRFQYLNPQLNYVLEQQDHGFVQGDVISVTQEGYVKSNALTAHKMIGVVTESGPGPHHFMIMPNNRIIDFDPGIPGVAGEEIYVDRFGQMSNVSTVTNKVMFLNVRSAIPTVLTGTGSNPEMAHGYTISINDADITFNNSGSNIALPGIVEHINSVSNVSSVVASIAPVETIAISSPDDTAYGLVGGYTPFSAYFNTGSGNTLIEFTSSGSQYPGVATPEDMAEDINAAGIANLVVIATETQLTLKELNGNSIILSDAVDTPNDKNFVGASNISGLPAITNATNAEKLVLTREDGGEIMIYESSDLFQIQTGIFSGHTGSVALAMNIEQGVRTGGTAVVADIDARDALTPAAGDGAYVINKGDGEWGLYLYTGDNWVETSNQDSATVDAKTLTTTFTMPIENFGTSLTQELGNISPGRKITAISVEVETPVEGYSGSILPNIEVGTVDDPDLFLDDDSNELTEAFTFYHNPEYLYPDSNTQDLTIQARCNHYDATVGNVVVKLTFV